MTDNPQAFPTGDHVNGGHDGMTLLDYFAGQALVMLPHLDLGETSLTSEEWARDAYSIAAAMLNERQSHANKDTNHDR